MGSSLGTVAIITRIDPPPHDPVSQRGTPATGGHSEPLAGARIAVVHEWLNGLAGSEQTFVEIANALPSAELFALTRNPDVSFEVGDRPIHCTPLDRVAARRGGTAWTLPLMPAAWHMVRAGRFDVVITSSHAFSRAFPPARRALHLSYTHTPLRYVWLADIDRRSATVRVPRALRWPFARLDRRYAGHVDSFAANSSVTRERIERFYGRSARVIPPPVDTDFFAPGSAPRGDHLLSVSRFVPYKRHDLAIRAAALTGRQLIVAGHGPDERRLRDLARRLHPGGVEFVVGPDRQTLRQLYREAAMLVFGAVEDFGIVPVEAQACGTPVVALRHGGTRDSVVDGVTGRLVERQDPVAFAEAIEELARRPADVASCRAQAERFSRWRFRSEIVAWIRDELTRQPWPALARCQAEQQGVR